jgi:enamine deaminase RidA (YjgF/YER057c/UK114 family)
MALYFFGCHRILLNPTLRNPMSDARDLAKPLANYAHSRRVGDLVLLAGQGCRDPKTDIWAGVSFDEHGMPLKIDFEAQVLGVLRNVESALAAEHLTRHHIVDVQVFLTNMKDQFEVMNKVWNEFFKEVTSPPVRTTVAVKELPGLNLIEMKVAASQKA